MPTGGGFVGLADTIVEIAKQSVPISPFASRPGFPPHTRRGLLPRAVAQNTNRRTGVAVIGTMRSRVGTVGGLHEKGGRRAGRRYPARPFIRPAMQRGFRYVPDAMRNFIRGKRITTEI